eukprot:TRINITY_DN10296_c0_g1_i1.p1 TRINITY_DN10296_c0_g1~~TRINITY_DN10296_c0_g1_i1.p1  ORF type:complete len:251 (+),score=62.39 TRINITY_DN10296_c0_g1_i1:62-814(+)
MTSTSWFVSGSNRGIGFNIVSQLSERKDTIVFAGVRDPSKATELKSIAEKNKNVHIVKLDSSSREDAKNAAKFVESTTGSLDYVIANAGIAESHAPTIELSEEIFLRHFQVNALGPLILFQELYPLLKKGDTKRFITVSSAAGSIGSVLPFPNTHYQTSKAAANIITRKIALEHGPEGFVVFPVHPGLVSTDMSKEFINGFPDVVKNLEAANIKVLQPDFSARSILKLADESKPEHNNKFLNFDGTEITW